MCNVHYLLIFYYTENLYILDIVGKGGHTPPHFSRSTPPLFRNPRCPHLS